jgi:hypothetical protein
MKKKKESVWVPRQEEALAQAQEKETLTVLSSHVKEKATVAPFNYNNKKGESGNGGGGSKMTTV